MIAPHAPNAAPTTAERREDVASYFESQGPLLGGKPLWTALGYRSNEAFRAARKRGLSPVKTHVIPGRRGVFAYTTDVVNWLASVGAEDRHADAEHPPEGTPM